MLSLRERALRLIFVHSLTDTDSKSFPNDDANEAEAFVIAKKKEEAKQKARE